MIEVRNLVKKYGSHVAVDDLNFTVEDGQIYGFLGPNGAGKSTTMNIITGCLAATSGEVFIDGHDIFKQPRKAKALIGFLPEQPPLYPDMTPVEYLDFVAELKGVSKKDRSEMVQSVMEKTGLFEVQNRLIKNISKGYKQRVGLAQAILGDPKVIILDEPTVGLDPAQIIEIRGLIKSLAASHTVIFSSHILSEVSEICSRILIINEGKIVAEDTPENLESRFISTPVLTVLIKGAPEAVCAALETLEGVADMQLSEGEDGTTEAVLTCEKGVDIKEPLALAMLQNGCLILRLEENRASLEDVFMELTAQQSPLPDPNDIPSTQHETFEVDAQALMDGTIGSAYDSHTAFDKPAEDTELPPDGTEPFAEETAPVEAPTESCAEETAPVDAPTESNVNQPEGGEDDAGDL